MAFGFATQEIAWLKKLQTDLRVTLLGPTVLMEDNQGAIAITKNPVRHARTKHIDIWCHYIHEAVQNGNVDLLYCPSEEMKADLLTKLMLRELLRCCVKLWKWSNYHTNNLSIKWEC